MSEEEKRALEFFKNNLEDIKELGKKYGFQEEIKNNEILLNYIDRLQKELEQEKENNEKLNDLILYLETKLNNIDFETKTVWRRIEKDFKEN